jgi:hypothetical protein
VSLKSYRSINFVLLLGTVPLSGLYSENHWTILWRWRQDVSPKRLYPGSQTTRRSLIPGRGRNLVCLLPQCIGAFLQNQLKRSELEVVPVYVAASRPRAPRDEWTRRPINMSHTTLSNPMRRNSPSLHTRGCWKHLLALWCVPSCQQGSATSFVQQSPSVAQLVKVRVLSALYGRRKLVTVQDSALSLHAITHTLTTYPSIYI